MTVEDKRKNDWMLESGAVTPRVLLIEPNGYVPMLLYKGWHGLPGGHVALGEAASLPLANILDPEVLAPTIIRETLEEGNIDITPWIRTRSAVLGFTEVDIIDREKHTITHAVSPIMICKIPGGLPFNEHIVKVPPGRIPIRTYPDAALALLHRERMKRSGARGPIYPDWLNAWGEVVFENHPEKRYIRGRPPFEALGLSFMPPSIPRTYPAHIRSWLESQYAKM